MSVIVSKIAGEELDPKKLYTFVKDNLRCVPTDCMTEGVSPDTHRRIMFATHIRTDRENLLVVKQDRFASIVPPPEQLVRQFGLEPFDSFMNDCALLSGKSLFDSVYRFTDKKVFEEFIQRSTCYPIGVYVLDDAYVVMSNIVVSETLISDPSISFRDGFQYTPIEAYSPQDRAQKELAQCLILTKG